MAEPENEQERPCLHCYDGPTDRRFLAEYPTTAESDKVDTDEADEVIDAIANAVEARAPQGGAAAATAGNPDFRAR
jgi:hypothetical protein